MFYAPIMINGYIIHSSLTRHTSVVNWTNCSRLAWEMKWA